MFHSSALYFLNLGRIITQFFTLFFDLVFKDVWSIIESTAEYNPFIDWIFESGVIDWLDLPQFLGSISLGTFLFSLICIALAIVYFFIP